MSLTRAFDRYYIIISLLCRDEYDASIKNLSRDLHVPVTVIRKDLVSLISSPLLKNCILVQTDDGPDYMTDVFPECERNRLKEDIISGSCDQYAFSLDSGTMDLDFDFETDLCSLLFPVLPSERFPLQENFSDFLPSKALFSNVYIKSSLSGLSPRQLEFIEKTEKAIAGQKQLYLRIIENGQTKLIQISPLNIFHNADDNIVYCIDINGNYYCSNDVKSIQISEKPIEKTIQDIHMEYLWGILYSKDEKPQPVTLQIQDNTPNIIRKIKSDTALRKHGQLIKNPDGTYLYKDIILGMDAFRRWLRGYGSSVIVLEPESLARQMYDSAVQMLNCYQTGTFF